MAGFLNMSEMSALALHAMAELARLAGTDAEGRLSVNDLSERLSASRHTLHKVITRLVNAELVESARGPAGGIRLAEPADAVSVLRVVEAVEGRIRVNGCLFTNRVCPPDKPCAFSCLTCGLEEHIRDFFTRTTIEDLLVPRPAETGQKGGARKERACRSANATSSTSIRKNATAAASASTPATKAR